MGVLVEAGGGREKNLKLDAETGLVRVESTQIFAC